MFASFDITIALSILCMALTGVAFVVTFIILRDHRLLRAILTAPQVATYSKVSDRVR